jgi:class 3 adenylate cyclase
MLVEHAGKLYIEAEGSTEQIFTTQIPLAERYDLPHSVINYVWHSKTNIVLDDGVHGAGQFASDPYLETAKSVLCTPILYQTKVLGILYIENHNVAHAFTDKRLMMVNLLSSQAAISLENARFYSAISRFVPSQFLNRLDKRDLIELRLGQHVKCPMSILFCDIRNFTPLSEALGAQEVFHLLNGFLGCMGPIISQYGGFIDKYIGDAIMALFNPEPESALSASIAMVKALKTFNLQQAKPLSIGIGINTGEVILGIIGSEKRIASTVIGDAVNIASRVEGQTKLFHVPLLISDNVEKKLKNPLDYALRLIDEVYLRGKSVPIKIWEVCAVDPEAAKLKMKTLDLFAEARKHYLRGELHQAKGFFELCLKQYPQDSVSELYMKKCEQRLEP